VLLAPAWIDISAQDWLPLLFLPVAALLAWWGYRRTTPALEPRQRLWFIILRTLAFSFLLIILASPILNRERNEPLAPRVAVLVDTSASMAAPQSSGAAAEPSRLEVARQVVRGVQTALGDERVEVEVIPFDLEVGDSRSIPDWLSQEDAADGPGTDILGALEETGERHAGENLQSVVLLTDGRATQGGLDASELRGIASPVYVVGLGDTLPAADLAIDRCDYAPVAYVESETAVRVRVENRGFRGQTSTLRLLRDGQTLFERPLSFDQESGRTDVEIPLQLEQPGPVRLSLRLDVLEGELTDRNNAREIRIHVLKNKIRALFVDARPSWDTAFLARLFRDDPNVEVRLVHQDAQRRWIDSSGEPVVLPTTQAELQRFDLFVVGSPGEDRAVPFWNLLPAAVEAGRGLLVLPGPSSVFTTMNVLEMLQPCLPVMATQQRTVRYRTETVQLTTQGQLHAATSSLTALADARRVLSSLPPVLVLHPGVHSKPGALDLLVLQRQEDQPVLAVSRYGRGQTAALCAAPVWRWGFTGQPQHRQAVTDLVGHLVRWLVQPRDVKRVQLTTGKPVVEGGQAVDLQAQVVDAQYQPLSDASLRVDVRRIDSPEEARASILLEGRSQYPGEYEGSLMGLGPGEYEATVVAERMGSYVGRDTTRFTVETYSVEFANTSQDVTFLRELAQRTGGRKVAAADVASWAETLPRAPRPLLLRSEIELWNTRTLFILFVLTLTAEWLLRKRRGLL
jgi:hypothetical protein